MPAHNILTGSELHEAKGTAAATVDHVFIADGAGSGAYAAIPEQLPTGTSAATVGQIFIADGAASGAFGAVPESLPTGTAAAAAGEIFIADGAAGGAFSTPVLLPQTEHISIQNANFGSGATAPSQVIVGNYNGWSFGIGDDSVFNLELPHNMDSAENIEVHITWAINEAFATASAEVNFQVDWSLVNHDDTEPVNAPNHTGTVTSGDINIPTTLYHVVHTVFVIAAANVADLDTLGVTLSRIALVGGTGPTAEPVVIAAHVEFTTNGT